MLTLKFFGTLCNLLCLYIPPVMRVCSGARPGYVFRSGECGVGYYLDLGDSSGDDDDDSAGSLEIYTSATNTSVAVSSTPSADIRTGTTMTLGQQISTSSGEVFMREDTFELEDLDVLGSQVGSCRTPNLFHAVV